MTVLLLHREDVDVPDVGGGGGLGGDGVGGFVGPVHQGRLHQVVLADVVLEVYGHQPLDVVLARAQHLLLTGELENN